MIDTKTSRPALTHRQQRVYEFLKDKILNRGYGPTVRELMPELGIKSPNGIMCHLKALEKKGYITREQGKSRAIQLTDNPRTVSHLPVAGTIAAGLPVVATESPELVELTPLFAGGNVAFRVADDSLAEQSIARGDFVVRDASGRNVAVIRRV